MDSEDEDHPAERKKPKRKAAVQSDDEDEEEEGMLSSTTFTFIVKMSFHKQCVACRFIEHDLLIQIPIEVKFYILRHI